MATKASSERVMWTGQRRIFSTDGKPRATAGKTRSSTNICRKNRISTTGRSWPTSLMPVAITAKVSELRIIHTEPQALAGNAPHHYRKRSMRAREPGEGGSGEGYIGIRPAGGAEEAVREGDEARSKRGGR